MEEKIWATDQMKSVNINYTIKKKKAIAANRLQHLHAGTQYEDQWIKQEKKLSWHEKTWRKQIHSNKDDT